MLSITETRKIIIGVDRLDYIKGISPRFNAPESFLGKHTEWVGKLVMIQVAIPSREDVKEYRGLASNLHRQAERINHKYGKDGPADTNGCDNVMLADT